MIVSKFANRAMAFIANDEQDRDKNYLNMRVKMNDRENLLSLLRKTGYERMPVHFSMTPDIEKRFYNIRKKPVIRCPRPRLRVSPGVNCSTPCRRRAGSVIICRILRPAQALTVTGLPGNPAAPNVCT